MSAAKKHLLLAGFLVLVLGGGSLIGLVVRPGEWYAGLAKPSFNPPNWIFAPVWTGLYVLIAIAGWRTWLRRWNGTSMGVWWTQMALNFAWTPVFFGLHLTGLALAVIVALLMAVAAFIVATRRVDPVSAILFAPYLIWISFATLLNAAIVTLN